MSDSDDKSGEEGIPSWQRGAPSQSSVPDSQSQDDLDVARRFLQDEKVQSASQEEKTSFLKAKGISDENIQKLLQEPAATESQSTEASSTSESQQQSTSSEPTTDIQLREQPTSTTPIITYPEFLTKTPKPPPLITQSTILTLLSSFAGLTTFLYGASNFLVQPMIEAQIESRHDLHASTAANLDKIIAELEKTVSEIPPSISNSRNNPIDEEEDEDPSELFHRDIGTQTSPSLVANDSMDFSSKQKPLSLSQQQSINVTSLNQKLASVKEGIKSQTESFEDIKSIIDVFRDDLDSMTYGAMEYLGGGYDPFNTMKNKNVPDDEIKKVRDAIRKVKGVLLSTRNFPSSTR